MLWKLPDIKIAPDIIYILHFGGFAFPITNTLVCTWVSIVILVALFYFGTRKRNMVPSGIQNVVEWIVESLLNLVENTVGKERGKKFFPLVATFFIFIAVSNLLDVFPGVDTIGAVDGEAIQKLHASCQPFLGFLPNCHPVAGVFLFGDISNKIVPWIRPATSDLNLTLAMAVISVIVTQAFGFRSLGVKQHLGKFFNFRGPIEFAVGLLEIVSEISRVVSFAIRLFGNIFAGSTVLAVFAFILPFLSGVIFIPFELFVAFVQAFVFALLTLIFMQIATTSHEHSESANEHEAHEQYERNKAEMAAA